MTRSQVESGRRTSARTPVVLGLIIIIKPITLADFALASAGVGKWTGQRDIVPDGI